MKAGMETWSYDGSAAGLLALTLRAYEERRSPAFVAARGRRGEGLFESQEAGPESDRGEEVESAEDGVAASLRAACPRLLGAALRAWMSEEAVEPALLAVAAEVGRRGELALGDAGMAELRVLAAAARRVNREIHRLIGLARFSRRADGLYVAPLEPDHDVLPAIAPAFLPRFGLPAEPLFAGDPGSDESRGSSSVEAFALLDLRRRYALLRPRGGGPRRALASFELLEGDAALALLPERDRGEDAELWRRYFRATENPGRHNPALQRRLMPRRYWRQLAEMVGTG
jgi:hypothetical protein